MGGTLPRALALGSAVAALVALTAAMTGWAVPGFGFAVLAALLFAMEGVVRRVASAGQLRPRVPKTPDGCGCSSPPFCSACCTWASG